MARPLRLTPQLRERVWGRKHLAPWFPDSETPIGEAWYLAGADWPPELADLPLLVKMLFTSERLSVQVHPDDGEDGARGKTEMWHIVEAEPGASIALGFREPITREQLLESTKSGAVEKLLNWVPVQAGETYFVPAHTVHAIGAGIVLFEIQQHSDVTYRLWDYGRPREIHVEKAVPIADLGVHPGAAELLGIAPAVWEVARSKHFVTSINENQRFTTRAEQCQLLICVSGSANVEGEEIRPGDVILLPEHVIHVENRGRLLHTYVPERL
jgi:mannose-6-phosphate isomerase